MSNIKIVTLWIGPRPEWHEKFTKHMAMNGDVLDWHLIQPPNVDWVNKQCEAATGYKTNKTMPRSVCDLRPAFGLMYKDIFRGYNWWGWCDFDVVFGDLSKFLTTDALENYEVISGASYLTDGPFTILRNTPEMCHLFHGNEFAEACLNPELTAFDEQGFCEIVKKKTKHLFGDWSSHDRHFPYRGCTLDGNQLYEVRDGWKSRQIAYYHFPGYKQWPLP